MLRSIAVILATLVFLTACSTTPREQPLRVAYQTSVASAVLMVAIEKGFLEEEGLTTTTQVFTSGSLVNEALASGQADIGAVGDVPTVVALAQGLPLEIVAVVGGGDRRQRLMVPPTSPYQTLADLQGKCLGITLGSSAHGGFYRLIEQQGLDLNQFTLINLSPSELPEALASQQVDAILAWEPTPSIISARQLGRELLTLENTGNSYPVMLLATKSFVARDPAELEACFRGLQKAAEYIQTNPEGAAQVVAKVTGLDQAIARNSLDYHFFQVSWPPETTAHLEDTANFLVEQGIIKAAPPLQQFINTELSDSLQLKI